MPILSTADGWFVDPYGRKVLLRGVNLGGSSKLPTTPPGATHLPTSLDPTAPVSFIGRPFDRAVADEHFARLHRWGFNVVRFIIPWEAVEHAGPGQYDERYLDWLATLIARAADYGILVFIGIHQDAWGRWSGGDGAPHWTYTLAGLHPATFDATEAAVTMQRRLPRYQPMAWTVNSARFAARTMTTLFLASDEFAPTLRIGSESLQQFLPRHFLAAGQRIAAALGHLPHVIGYGFLNELGTGYIGHSLEQPARSLVHGPQLSGFDGMVLAAGIPRRVPYVYALGMAQLPFGKRLLNRAGVSAWQPGATDIWQEAQVWELQGDTPVLLRPDHFRHIAGRPVNPHQRYIQPLVQRFAETIHAVHPDACIFVENGVLGELPTQQRDAPNLQPLVNATHWYDAVTLFSRRPFRRWSFDVYRGRHVVGVAAVQRMFVEQLGLIKQAAHERMQGCPTLIGEFGLPFNAPVRRRRRDAYRAQERLLAMYYAALDAHLLSATQWNYTADNDHRWGDQWNREDLSIYSRDDRDLGDDGARALRGFSRPYARATAGTPVAMHFDHATSVFHYRYYPDPRVQQPTELVVPPAHYSHGYTIFRRDTLSAMPRRRSCACGQRAMPCSRYTFVHTDRHHPCRANSCLGTPDEPDPTVAGHLSATPHVYAL